MNNAVVVLAGATGKLGTLIARSLTERGGKVRAIVRRNGAPARIEALKKLGVTIAEVDFHDPKSLSAACAGASCVVSALAGLRDVIVDAQTLLLEAAVDAGVPRFIPSDYCIDFTKLPDGSNRNFDLRREFQTRLDRAPISATSIFNGMFTDMLTGQAPIVLFKRKRIMYWENADQLLDFTTIDDTAAFTASAALETSTPRFLRVAGDQISARGLAEAASEVTGEKFKLFRAGGLGRLRLIIRIARKLFPASSELYPPWQGMQYLENMFSGKAKLEPLDNRRYGRLRFTTARDVLSTFIRAN